MYVAVHLYNHADIVHRTGVIFTQTLCHQSQLSLADDACDSVLNSFQKYDGAKVMTNNLYNWVAANAIVN